MKKQFFAWLLFVVMLTSCLGVGAMDTERCVGDVLYHQDFSAVEAGGAGGVCLGTSSSAQSYTSCAGEALLVQTYDSGRVYVLLPPLEMESASFTLEFSFRFTAVHKENGFLAPILTCRGERPSNISSVVLRADGSADHFESSETFLAEAAQAGESIHVQIPVQNGAVHEITFTTENGTCTLERENVLMINQGRLGFCVRNADVAIEEVYVVCGTGYTEKAGTTHPTPTRKQRKKIYFRFAVQGSVHPLRGIRSAVC